MVLRQRTSADAKQIRDLILEECHQAEVTVPKHWVSDRSVIGEY